MHASYCTRNLQTIQTLPQIWITSGLPFTLPRSQIIDGDTTLCSHTCIVGNSDITPFLGNVRLDGDPPGTTNQRKGSAPEEHN